MRAIERRLLHLEELIPLPLTYVRFAARVSEYASHRGVSPGSALVSVIEDLNGRDLDRLLNELGGERDVRSERDAPGAIRSDAIKAGFSPADAESFVQHLGEREGLEQK